MIRRRSRVPARGSDANTVSLFPFLAVLTSTMGVLILLLVVISQHTKTLVEQEQRQRATDTMAELERDEGIARWQVEAIRSSYEAARNQLTEARQKLGVVEDHLRALRETARQLQATLTEIQREGDSERRRQEEIEAELARTLLAIEVARQEVAALRDHAAQQPPRYAIIPFDGRSQTYRRPIYLECTASGVTLQPEGIRLTGVEDLPFLTSPSNALDRTLRAIREHWAAQGAIASQGEPYPLLIIRPSGIRAYYAARLAMQSWNTEFGYEPVDDETELAYPPPDEHLRPQIAAIVEETQVAQRQIRAMLPVAASRSLSPSEILEDIPAQRFTASPHHGGGIVREAPRLDDLRRETFPSPGLSPQTASGGPAAGGAGTSPGYRAPTAMPGAYGAGYGGYDANRLATGRPLDAQGGPPGQHPGGWPGPPTSESGDASGASSPARFAGSASSAPGGGGPGGATPDTTSGEFTVRLADVRGKNWALPRGSGYSGNVRRSVRVDCHADHLTVVPERGLAGGRTIEPRGPLRGSIDALVAAIWEQTDQWGSAGPGMQWRPMVSVHILPGGEERFAELQHLLSDSGLEVEATSTPAGRGR